MTFYFLLLYLALKSLASNSSMCSNLGVIFDQYMPKTLKKKHVELLSFIWAILLKLQLSCLSDAEKLVHAFITSSLNYYYFLISGCSESSMKSLQLIQNAAVGIAAGTAKRDYISSMLACLHWLPVKSFSSYTQPWIIRHHYILKST